MGCVALALLVPGAASAEPTLSAAVLDIQVANIDESLVSLFSEILTSEIHASSRFASVIAGRDVAAMLSFEERKQALGCEDDSCLAEIGGALGVDRIVAGHIGRLGVRYIINLKIIDILKARTVARSYESYRVEDSMLPEAIRDSVRKLFDEAAAATGALQDASSLAADGTGASRPILAIGDLVAPISVGAAGLIAIGVGAGFGLKARGHHANATEPDFVGAQNEVAAGKTSALIANISFSVGGAALLTSLVIGLVSGSGTGASLGEATVSVGLSPSGLSIGGAF